MSDIFDLNARHAVATAQAADLTRYEVREALAADIAAAFRAALREAREEVEGENEFYREALARIAHHDPATPGLCFGSLAQLLESAVGHAVVALDLPSAMLARMEALTQMSRAGYARDWKSSSEGRR